VTNVVPLPNYQNSRKSQRTTIEDFTVGPYYQITLDRVLKAGFDYLAGNPNANGAGFVLLNNIIRNNREHGMILFGDNGIVEGNLIDGSTVEESASGHRSFGIFRTTTGT
jgi:parallel beta-helix repeat protein